MQKQHNISLLPHNTFGIDVKAHTVIKYADATELSELIRNTRESLSLPLLHIGQGSNLLFMNYFRGTILLNNNTEIEVLQQDQHNILVRVGAGYVMDDFISHAIEQGWYGLENLSNIPGQVGASAVQNIGAYGVEVGSMIHSVSCISLEDGSPKTFMHDECCFSYRYSIFKSEEIRGKYAVVAVTYSLSLDFLPHLDYGGIRQALAARGVAADDVTAQELRDTIITIRGNKLPDPKVLGNAGSFFMNPIVSREVFERNVLSAYPEAPSYPYDSEHVKLPAAWLIEQCGWKGKTLGKAGVHSQQPLVLVNTGGAEGSDIKALSDTIQKDVTDRFGIDIYPEVNFIY